jgi:hypothetical protein
MKVAEQDRPIAFVGLPVTVRRRSVCYRYYRSRQAQDAPLCLFSSMPGARVKV